MFLFIVAPLLSLIASTLGVGLLTTLLALRVHEMGGGAIITGLLTAAYYLGMVAGSLQVGHIIRRIGHIRIYAAFASILAITTLLYGIFSQYWLWIVLRIIGGYCLAGLYVAIQSWLLAIYPHQKRGKILAIYMITFYASLASGQLLLNVSDPQTILPFCLITILCAFSIVPISMTRATSPTIEKTAALSIVKLSKISPSGVVCSFAAGMITSVIYGLMPLFLKQFGLATFYIALSMSLTIFGAMAIQYPVGYWSDYVERRKLLLWASVFTVLMSVVLIAAIHLSNTLFAMLSFIFGGVAFIIYPLSVSHTCDYLPDKDIVAAVQGVLLVNGIGSILGPVIAPGFIYVLGRLGIFIYFAVVAGALTGFMTMINRHRSSPPKEEQRKFGANHHL